MKKETQRRDKEKVREEVEIKKRKRGMWKEW